MATSIFNKEEITGGASLDPAYSGRVGRITRSSDKHYIIKTIYLEDGNYRYPLPNQYASAYVYEPDSTTTEIYVATNQQTYMYKWIHWTLELDKMCNHYS